MTADDLQFVRLYRSITAHEMWTDGTTFDQRSAWIDILMAANSRPRTFLVRGIRVFVDRGQLGWSRRTMATRWGWSRDRAGRFLAKLEKAEMITIDRSVTITTLLSVVNYERFNPEFSPEKRNAVEATNRTSELGPNRATEISIENNGLTNNLGHGPATEFGPFPATNRNAVDTQLSSSSTASRARANSKDEEKSQEKTATFWLPGETVKSLLIDAFGLTRDRVEQYQVEYLIWCADRDVAPSDNQFRSWVKIEIGNDQKTAAPRSTIKTPAPYRKPPTDDERDDYKRNARRRADQERAAVERGYKSHADMMAATEASADARALKLLGLDKST